MVGFFFRTKSSDLFFFVLGKASIEFLTLCIVLVGTSCVFGTMIYTIERTTNPASTILYPNVGNGVYYAILAITNVGFEGFLPTTYLGKWIACAAITIGIVTSMEKKFFLERFSVFYNSCFGFTIDFIVIYSTITD